MGDPVGASMRIVLGIVFCLTAVFGTIYGVMIGLGHRDDHPGWVAAGWVGLGFTGGLIASLLLWLLGDICCDGSGTQFFRSNKRVGALACTISTVCLAGIAITIWLTVRGTRNSNHSMQGGAICALVHLLVIGIPSVAFTGMWLRGFCEHGDTNGVPTVA